MPAPIPNLLIIEASDSARLVLYKKLKAETDFDFIPVFSNNTPQAIHACSLFQFDFIVCNLSMSAEKCRTLIGNIRKSALNKNSIFCTASSNLKMTDPDESDALLFMFDKAAGFSSLIKYISQKNINFQPSNAEILFISKSPTLVSVIENSGISRFFQLSHFAINDQLFERLNTHQNYKISLILIHHTNIDHGQFSGIMDKIRNEFELSPKEIPIMAILDEAVEKESVNYAQLFSLGINDFIHQPVIKETLLDKIKTLTDVTRNNHYLPPKNQI